MLSMRLISPVIGLLIAFIFSSCNPTSSRDYQLQARDQISQLVKDLKKLQDPVQLQRAQKKLKKHFIRLSKTLICYANYIEKHPELNFEPSEELQSFCLELESELNRLYRLDGGRELVEDSQEDAYLKLSLFENSKKGERLDFYKSHKSIMQH